MTFARIEDNPDSNAAALGLVERIENDGIREGVGREVNRAFAVAIRAASIASSRSSGE